MTRKHLILSILPMFMVVFLMVGCSPPQANSTPTKIEPTSTQPEPTLTQTEPTPTQAEPSPTPIVPTLTPEDPSIVWSDDFEDGDAESWEFYSGKPVRDVNVVEGAFSISGESIIMHPSTVTTGTWSFDIFIPEDDLKVTNEIWFILSTAGDLQDVAFPITIEHQPSTELAFTHSVGSANTVMGTVTIGEGERLTSWHHIDITRDDDGNVKVFFNREFVFEFNEDFPNEPDVFAIWFCCQGPALDNVVVRNQVLEIQPVE